ncbi:hypothetical protein QA447_20825 [Pseudomonas sp. abacavir_1]
MSKFWSSELAFFFMTAPYAIGILGMAAHIYVTFRHRETITRAFPNSPIIRNHMATWMGHSIPARLIQTSMVSGIILWPTIHIRRGDLDPEEIRNFPYSIRLIMSISAGLMITGVLWGVLSVLILKLSYSS